MPKISIYNQTGTEQGSMELNPAHFGAKLNPGVLHEVIVAQEANSRQPIANAKTRGEVRGGGKKPWKQKGTGRARQGSIRSPQWVGGGITFGPTSERNFSLKVNRKLKQKALFMALSEKVSSGRMFALESFSPSDAKTKFAAELLRKLPIHRNVLAIIPASDPKLLRMVRNLQNVQLVTVNSLNVRDVVAYQTVVFWKDAIAAFETIYASTK